MFRILVLTLSFVFYEPRVLRQLPELAARYDVTVAGIGPAKVEGCKYIELSKSRSPIRKLATALQILIGVNRLTLMESFYWKQLKGHIQDHEFDLVIAHDVCTLPIAFEVGDNTPVLLDAHEYAPDDDAVGITGKIVVKRNTQICDNYLHRVAGMVTVSSMIADLYSRTFNIQAPRVVPNAGRFRDLKPSPVRHDEINLVHHGIYTPQRGIETLIKAAGALGSGYVLNLMLIGNPVVVAKLRRIADKFRANVVFHEPVRTDEIPSYINKFDIGLYALPPTTQNAQMALPNKFFENVQARLCQVLAPTGEMQLLLTEYSLGKLSSGFNARSLARAISQLSVQDIEFYKNKAHEAAQHLCWESYRAEFLKAVTAALQVQKKDCK